MDLKIFYFIFIIIFSSFINYSSEQNLIDTTLLDFLHKKELETITVHMQNTEDEACICPLPSEACCQCLGISSSSLCLYVNFGAPGLLTVGTAMGLMHFLPTLFTDNLDNMQNFNDL